MFWRNGPLRASCMYILLFFPPYSCFAVYNFQLQKTQLIQMIIQYGLFTTAYAGGMMVGPLWAGLVESSAGWTTMCWTLGLLSAVSTVPAGLFTGGSLWKRGEKSDAADVENVSNTETGDTATVREEEKPETNPT